MSEKKMKWSVPDHTGFIHPEEAKKGELEDLFPETLAKYNHCHGANGQFCSSGGSSGGGGSVTAPEMAGSEEFLAQEQLSPEYLGKPDEVVMEVYESNSFTRLVNRQGLSDDEALRYVDKADAIAGKTQVENLKTFELDKIAEPTAFAQCSFSFWPEGDKVMSKETLRVDAHPDKIEMAKRGYEKDRQAIAEGKMPWLAGGYAKTEEGNTQALLNHEVGHAVLGEHTIKKPVKEWANPDNPLQGTKSWHNTLLDAIDDGWAGSSLYGRQNPGEMFAESFALLTIKGSTGNKGIDDFVVKVVKNG